MIKSSFNCISKRNNKKLQIISNVHTLLITIDEIMTLSECPTCQMKKNNLNQQYKILSLGINTIITETWLDLPILPCKRKFLKEKVDKILLIRKKINEHIMQKGYDDENFNQQMYFEENQEAKCKYNNQYYRTLISNIMEYKPYLKDILNKLS